MAALLMISQNFPDHFWGYCHFLRDEETEVKCIWGGDIGFHVCFMLQMRCFVSKHGLFKGTGQKSRPDLRLFRPVKIRSGLDEMSESVFNL